MLNVTPSRSDSVTYPSSVCCLWDKPAEARISGFQFPPLSLPTFNCTGLSIQKVEKLQLRKLPEKLPAGEKEIYPPLLTAQSSFQKWAAFQAGREPLWTGMVFSRLVGRTFRSGCCSCGCGWNSPLSLSWWGPQQVMDLSGRETPTYFLL